MNLKDISTKELFLELLKRDGIDSARGFGSRPGDFDTAYDSYQIETFFHLTNEEWGEHFVSKPPIISSALPK
jgi:hypothetical protein